MQIKSYLEQLREQVESQEKLKEAFARAGVPDSTFYRVLHGQDLRLATATKVARSLQERDRAAKESLHD